MTLWKKLWQKWIRGKKSEGSKSADATPPGKKSEKDSGPPGTQPLAPKPPAPPTAKTAQPPKYSAQKPPAQPPASTASDAPRPSLDLSDQTRTQSTCSTPYGPPQLIIKKIE